ncbi:MAG TPA: HepT-like ribonuclease domain-containing protein [Arthrobacter sp.]|nr:HepT-like ribonuclease domain-containing protein [Arthrobacter sp.]
MGEPKERIDRWLSELSLTLDKTEELVARGRAAFDQDPALPLAFEALCNRVGDLAKRVLSADPDRFSDPIWRQAARNRDFVVRHYDRLDKEALWVTVTVSFPELRRRLD